MPDWVSVRECHLSQVAGSRGLHLGTLGELVSREAVGCQEQREVIGRDGVLAGLDATDRRHIATETGCNR